MEKLNLYNKELKDVEVKINEIIDWINAHESGDDKMRESTTAKLDKLIEMKTIEHKATMEATAMSMKVMGKMSSTFPQDSPK